MSLNISNPSTREKVDYILEEMKRVYKNDNRPWIIGYSGGKDSTAVVQLVFEMVSKLPVNERTKKIYIVSSDTLIENPIVLGYLKEASSLIDNAGKELNIASHIVTPDVTNSYWYNIIGKGLPTPTSIRFRWCTERLKIKPSNQFIENTIKENGEVIVLLGVRKAESIARKIRIQNREIEGYLLTPHTTLQNTYVYNPIVDLTTDDVWEILLSNNGINPWGGDNKELFSLYAGADAGECPFTITANEKGEIDTPSCGNSRFGCWICTVVKEDKSLTGFITNGEEWLYPLLEFREWILGIRNKHEYRQQYRRDGNHYYKKLYIKSIPLLEDYEINPDCIFSDPTKGLAYIDLKHKKSIHGNNPNTDEKDKVYLELLPMIDETKIDSSKILEDEKGAYVNVLGYGPFNFEARKIILRKLLETQKVINESVSGFDLITIDELKAIDNLWDNEEDLGRTELVEIYYDVFGEKLPWHDFKKPIIDKEAMEKVKNLCEEFNVDIDLFNKLLIETNNNKLYTNKNHLSKSISKVLNQKYLHKTIIEEIDNVN